MCQEKPSQGKSGGQMALPFENSAWCAARETLEIVWTFQQVKSQRKQMLLHMVSFK